MTPEEYLAWIERAGDDYALLVGRVIVAGTFVEVQIEYAIWGLFGFHSPFPQEGYAITSPLRTTGKLKLLRTIASIKMDADHRTTLRSILAEADKFHSMRNRLVHGPAYLILNDDGLDRVQTSSVKAEGSIKRKSEEFTLNQLRELETQANAICSDLFNLMGDHARRHHGEQQP